MLCSPLVLMNSLDTNREKSIYKTWRRRHPSFKMFKRMLTIISIFLPKMQKANKRLTSWVLLMVLKIHCNHVVVNFLTEQSVLSCSCLPFFLPLSCSFLLLLLSLPSTLIIFQQDQFPMWAVISPEPRIIIACISVLIIRWKHHEHLLRDKRKQGLETSWEKRLTDTDFTYFSTKTHVGR